MKHRATLFVCVLALGLRCGISLAPSRALAQVGAGSIEGALGLTSPRPGQSPPPSAIVPSSSPPPALSQQEELDRLALTYGHRKAVQGYRMGFVFSSAAFLLSMLWVAHPQE